MRAAGVGNRSAGVGLFPDMARLAWHVARVAAVEGRDREDVWQDVFLGYYEALAAGASEDDANRRAMNDLIRASRAPAGPRFEPIEDHEGDVPAEMSEEERLLGREEESRPRTASGRERAVREALRSLSPARRKALARRFGIRGRGGRGTSETVAETARREGVSRRGVRKGVASALAAIRERMAGDGVSAGGRR